jgi:6-phosphogluconolactonase (cycloisomerase 2 family)
MKRVKTVFIVVAMGSIAFYGCKKDDLNDESASLSQNVSQKVVRPEFDNPGAVYVLSNSASGNEVLMYHRSSKGSLSLEQSFATGGNGTGSGLGSQGSLILQEFGRSNYLYAVNAGSNEVTVFRVDDDKMTWVDKASSHGIMPISVTAHGDLLYVLNAGGSGNISGVHISPNGHLAYMENSTKALSSDAAGPAEIQFNNQGTQLVVTEKNTNGISTYAVHGNGLTSNVIFHSAVGITPFGFAFNNHDQLIVTDAFGGATNQSAVTFFHLGDAGHLSLIDGPVGTNQTSACWLTITNNGRYCYATNTGSASITGYRIHDGKLTLLNANGVTANTGTTPIDVSLSNNSKFLYNVNSTSHSISIFHVNEDGSLDTIGNVDGLPPSAVGIAAR